MDPQRARQGNACFAPVLVPRIISHLFLLSCVIAHLQMEAVFIPFICSLTNKPVSRGKILFKGNCKNWSHQAKGGLQTSLLCRNWEGVVTCFNSS